MDDAYVVLGLSQRQNDTSLTLIEIRKAYQRTLLKYHPDKSTERAHAEEGTPSSAVAGPTVDQITAAYKILSNPQARREYDQRQTLELQQGRRQGRAEASELRFFSGLDVVDLDDLDFDEVASCWRRTCRCGHEEGFVVTEEDLDAVASSGELITGCRGCSLWLKVLFQVDAS